MYLLPITFACFRRPNATKRRISDVSLQPLTIRPRLVFVYVYPFKGIRANSFPTYDGLLNSEFVYSSGDARRFLSWKLPGFRLLAEPYTVLYMHIPSSTIMVVFCGTCNV